MLPEKLLKIELCLYIWYEDSEVAHAVKRADYFLFHFIYLNVFLLCIILLMIVNIVAGPVITRAT